MTTRPYRERSVGDIISIVERGVRRTGYEKVNLLSLSAGDYSHIEDLVERLSSKNIRISLPSLRGDTLTPKIAKYMEKGGITLAPETGTEKLRRVINKEIDEEKTLYSLRIAKNAGFTHAKLYFMIGLPLEDSQDIQGIIKFVSKVRSIPIKVSISPFVPRPHTPFQWERQASIKELREKIHYLRKNLRGVKFNYRDPIGCFLEGIFSRGDERLAQVIERAYRNGARFDEWSEKFDFSLWQSAFDSQGINPEEYLRQRDINESLPWDNIDMGIKKEYLLKEREKAFSLKYTPDCRIIGCTGCGICDGTNLIPMPKKTTIIHQYGRWPVKKETSGVRIRYRIKFEKGEKLRFIGHLDTARLIIMAIKKSNLPVLYTKGFKPKPRLSFSPPLPLLMTSKSEFIDIWMERIPKGNVLETIQKNLPSGIKLLKSSIISLKEKSLSETAIFERVSVFNVGIEEKQIQEFMKRDIIPVVKRDKEFDIRKSIIDMKKEDNDLIILKKISKVKIFWILENLLKISPEDSLKLKIEREELLKLDGKKLDFS